MLSRFFYLLCTVISIIGIIYIVFTALFTVTITDNDEDDQIDD